MQVQVRWGDLQNSMATWEEGTQFSKRFLFTLAWGQAMSQEGENVRTVPLQCLTEGSQESVNSTARPDDHEEDKSAGE